MDCFTTLLLGSLHVTSVIRRLDIKRKNNSRHAISLVAGEYKCSSRIFIFVCACCLETLQFLLSSLNIPERGLSSGCKMQLKTFSGFRAQPVVSAGVADLLADAGPP